MATASSPFEPPGQPFKSLDELLAFAGRYRLPDIYVTHWEYKRFLCAEPGPEARHTLQDCSTRRARYAILHITPPAFSPA